MSETSTPALAVGAVMGDIDGERTWGPAIGTLSRRVKAARAGVESPIRLNVQYHVDGRLAPNDFEGVRTGRFRKSDSLLIVQAAVPAEAATDQQALLAGLLAEAVDAAEAFATKKGFASDLKELRTLVEEVAAS